LAIDSAESESVWDEQHGPQREQRPVLHDAADPTAPFGRVVDLVEGLLDLHEHRHRGVDQHEDGREADEVEGQALDLRRD
jgi:hypothetical protein